MTDVLKLFDQLSKAATYTRRGAALDAAQRRMLAALALAAAVEIEALSKPAGNRQSR